MNAIAQASLCYSSACSLSKLVAFSPSERTLNVTQTFIDWKTARTTTA